MARTAERYCVTFSALVAFVAQFNGYFAKECMLRHAERSTTLLRHGPTPFASIATPMIVSWSSAHCLQAGKAAFARPFTVVSTLAAEPEISCTNGVRSRLSIVRPRTEREVMVYQATTHIVAFECICAWVGS